MTQQYDSVSIAQLTFIQLKPGRHTISSLLAISLACATVWGTEATLLAQFDDPFGIMDPATPELIEPTPPPPEISDDEPEETDPLVLAIQDTDPRTPQDLFRAVKVLMDIGRFDQAETYLSRLEAMELDTPTLLRLQRRYGDSFLIRLKTAESLAPAGGAMAERIFAAAKQRAEDPGRVSDLVQRISDSTDRSNAIGRLRGMTREVMVPLIKQLADESQSEHHSAIQQALVELDSQATEPLLAALESPDASFRLRVLEVISARNDQTSVPYLIPLAFRPDVPVELREAAEKGLKRQWGELPSVQRATDQLTQRFHQAFQVRELPEDDDLQLWRWDDDGQTVAAYPASVADRQRLAARRWAQTLHDLSPENKTFQIYRLAAELEFEQAMAGLDVVLDSEHPVVTRALEMDPEDLNLVLRFCLRQDRVAGAIGAVRVLGASGDITQLHSGAGKENSFSPLADALHHRHQLLQAAALEAIMQLRPQEPFPGSHRFSELVGYFLRSRPSRRALVIHPRIDEGRTLVGLLAEMGFEAEWAARGKEGLRLATVQPDYEFVLISDATSSPSAAETVQLLRSSSRSKGLPAAIMIRDLPIDLISSPTLALEEMAAELGRTGREGLVIPDAEELSDMYSGFSRIAMKSEVDLYRRRQFDRYLRYAEEDPLLVVIPPPRSPDSLRFAVRRLMSLPGEHRGTQSVALERRSRRCAAILDWLADAIESPMVSHLDLTRLEEDVFQLMYYPDLSAKAARVLGLFASPNSQQLLVDVASQPTLATVTRLSAASAFTEAVERRGLLLTQDSILRQYDRYNAAETLDPDTQAVLSTILDAIELPRSRRTSQDGLGTP